MDFTKFIIRQKTRVVAIPAIGIFIYFDKLATEIAKPVAKGIQKYIDFVGFDKLKQYVGTGGYWRKLTRNKFQKDMSLLQDYPTDLIGLSIEYNSSEDGTPGPYGLYLFLRDKKLETEPLSTNFLRFDFDYPIIDPKSVEEFVAFYINLVEELPFQSSNAGYCFKRIQATENKATSGVNKKINRYFGFDPGYEPVRDDMLNCVFTPHWLNAINHSIEKGIGGYEKIEASLSSTSLTKIDNGIVMRGARMPPIGDINHGAPDIGSIPEIARLLKPYRTKITALGEFHDAQEWLTRYDGLENRPWN